MTVVMERGHSHFNSRNMHILLLGDKKRNETP